MRYMRPNQIGKSFAEAQEGDDDTDYFVSSRQNLTGQQNSNMMTAENMSTKGESPMGRNLLTVGSSGDYLRTI